MIRFDEKTGKAVIELALNLDSKEISPSGKSYKVAQLNEKVTAKGKVITINLNAFEVIPKASRK